MTGSPPAADQPLPNMPTKPGTEGQPNPVAKHSDNSSPVEPFPELDLEIGAEPNPSPTFAHEADVHILPAVLSLPAPALRRIGERETGPLVYARVTWSEGQEREEERGDMREATARALEFARQMFGKDAERKSSKARTQSIVTRKKNSSELIRCFAWVMLWH